MRVYFVGFAPKSDRYWNAVRIWGRCGAIINLHDKSDAPFTKEYGEHLASCGDLIIWA